VKSIVSAINDEDISEHFELAYKVEERKYAKDIATQLRQHQPVAHRR
jgi:hypothetical protein